MCQHIAAISPARAATVAVHALTKLYTEIMSWISGVYVWFLPEATPTTVVIKICTVCVYVRTCLLACSHILGNLNERSYITKIELMHSVGEGLLPEFSIGDSERRRLKLKHAWQFTPCC